MSYIELELISDTCPGSGSGYSNYVDADVCYDEMGIPYIPARRLKGCLREAAEYYGIDQETIQRLFGTVGASEPGKLALDNGYPVGAERMRAWLKGKDYSAQQVIDAFTTVRAVTALDDYGIAKDESLRYIRVLQARRGDQRQRYIFSCDVPADDKETMQVICKAMRHLGTNRSRGLGAVCCAFVSKADSNPDEYESMKVADGPNGGQGEEQVRRQIVVHTDGSIVLRGESDEESRNYITGTVLRGALASRWIAAKRRTDSEYNADHDPEFSEIFLSGKVKFGNLYIASRGECDDGEKVAAAIPAPYFLAKTKSSNRSLDGNYLTSVLSRKQFVSEKLKDSGMTSDEIEGFERLLQTKPLRGKLVSIETDDPEKLLMQERPVRTERVYHHSVYGPDRKSKEYGGDTSLYTQSVISAGQDFAGYLEGSTENLVKIEKLLSEPLRLGSSRTAEHGRCTAKLFKESRKVPSISDLFQEENMYLIALESDLIPWDQKAPFESVVQEIFSCGGQEGEEIHLTVDMDYTSADCKAIHGYNARRNLRTSPVRAMMMGSVIAVRRFDESQDQPENRIIVRAPGRAWSIPQTGFIGRRNDEGFGVVRVWSRAELEKEIEAVSEDDIAEMAESAPDEKEIQWFIDAMEAWKPDEAGKLARQLREEHHEWIEDAGRNSLSMIGRVRTMVAEALNEGDMLLKIEQIENEDRKKYYRKIYQEVQRKTREYQSWLFEKQVWMKLLSLLRYSMKGGD